MRNARGIDACTLGGSALSPTSRSPLPPLLVQRASPTTNAYLNTRTPINSSFFKRNPIAYHHNAALVSLMNNSERRRNTLNIEKS